MSKRETICNFQLGKSWFAILIIIVLFSCNKNNLEGIQLDYETVKVYDDSLACTENPNVHISSGRERLYMTYGRGTSITPIINGEFISTNAEISSVVMATDLRGNFIWNHVLPNGLAATTPVELSDGTCVVVCANIYGYNYNIPNETIKIYQFDVNGNPLISDSLVIPSIVGPAYLINSIDLLWLSGQEVLIYGSVVDNNWSTLRGFALKYHAGSGIKWVKPVDFNTPVQPFDQNYIYNCIRTRDGGLLFLGSYNGPGAPGQSGLTKNVLIKTDAECEKLWTRWYDYMNLPPAINYVSPTNVIQAANGDFWFCTNDISAEALNSNKYLDFNSYIYHLNESGDSIGGIIMNGHATPYCSSIAELSDNSIVGVFNKYPDYIYYEMETYFSTFNSNFYSFTGNHQNTIQEAFQNRRTDFLTASCKISNGGVAFFGLTRTSDHRYYNPSLIIKD